MSLQPKIHPHKVNVLKLSIQGTVEERILALQESKAATARQAFGEVRLDGCKSQLVRESVSVSVCVCVVCVYVCFEGEETAEFLHRKRPR